MTTIYCPKGFRRCSVSKKCVRKIKTRKALKPCAKGSRRCSNKKCYIKNKSVKSRNSFLRKIGLL